MKSWWDILLISHLGPRSFFVFGMLRMAFPDLPVSVTLNMLWEQRLFWTAGFWDSLLLYTLQPVLYLCSTLQPLLYPCHSVPTFAFALHANCTLHVVPLLSTDCTKHRIHTFTVHTAHHSPFIAHSTHSTEWNAFHTAQRTVQCKKWSSMLSEAQVPKRRAGTGREVCRSDIDPILVHSPFQVRTILFPLLMFQGGPKRIAVVASSLNCTL